MKNLIKEFNLMDGGGMVKEWWRNGVYGGKVARNIRLNSFLFGIKNFLPKEE